MKNLSEKTALVTGAASGIGQEIAQQLAFRGVDLFLLDINSEALEKTAAKITASCTVNVTTFSCDLSDPRAIQKTIQELLVQNDGVDLVINNAGVSYHGPTDKMLTSEWQQIMAVNLEAPLLITQLLLPSLLARPESHIINLASICGLVGFPKVAAYCTTKHAMVGFSDALRAEYGRVGLGVTAVCPGFVNTNLFAKSEEEVSAAKPKRPPRLICTTSETVAKAVVRAIHRNRRRVVLEPTARLFYAASRVIPGVVDWLLQLGRGKRIRQKTAKWEKRRIAFLENRQQQLQQTYPEPQLISLESSFQKQAKRFASKSQKKAA